MKKLQPMKNYVPPDLPTLEAARGNPELLKKLPKRWRKISQHAAATACAGIFALSAFSAIPPRTVYASENYAEAFAAARAELETAELVGRMHHGGSGMSIYVVYFTEQDAFGFIRAKLEAAGLNFSADVPDISAEIEMWLHMWDDGPTRLNFGLDLFDAEKGVGVTNIADFPQIRDGWGLPRYAASRVAEAFAEQENNIAVGTFFSPGVTGYDMEQLHSEWARAMWEEHGDETMQLWEWFSANSDNPLLSWENFYAWRDDVAAERRESARPALIENLTAQAQTFITRLEHDGILQPQETGEIRVMLDGRLLDFDVAPQVIDGRTLVPMRAIFEALEYEVEWREETQDIFALRSWGQFILIDMKIGDSVMSVLTEVYGDAFLEHKKFTLEVPPQIIDGRTFVPIRAIAEATGAIVEWNEATRTINIIR